MQTIKPTTDPLPDQQLRVWIALAKTPGVGPKTLHRLLSAFDSVDHVFNANATQLSQAGISKRVTEALQAQSLSQADSELAWRDQSEHHHIITLACAGYPPLLKEIADPPSVLYINGQLDLLSEPQLGMVGSRYPTASGKQIATDFARYLAKQGITITSGMALGVLRMHIIQ